MTASVELPVIALLERLGRGETVENAAASLRVSLEDAQASFRQAARTIRSIHTANTIKSQTQPVDWQTMTVADALEVLAEHAARKP